MRQNLKNARQKAGMTQQQMADKLHITIRHYKAIESGERLGSIELWDAMEELFSINQRKLREISEIRRGKEDNL